MHTRSLTLSRRKPPTADENNAKTCNAAASAQTDEECRDFLRIREYSKTDDDSREKVPQTTIGLGQGRISNFKQALLCAARIRKKTGTPVACVRRNYCVPAGVETALQWLTRL
jgi:hypothetical protein